MKPKLAPQFLVCQLIILTCVLINTNHYTLARRNINNHNHHEASSASNSQSLIGSLVASTIEAFFHQPNTSTNVNDTTQNNNNNDDKNHDHKHNHNHHHHHQHRNNNKKTSSEQLFHGGSNFSPLRRVPKAVSNSTSGGVGVDTATFPIRPPVSPPPIVKPPLKPIKPPIKPPLKPIKPPIVKPPLLPTTPAPVVPQPGKKEILHQYIKRILAAVLKIFRDLCLRIRAWVLKTRTTEQLIRDGRMMARPELSRLIRHLFHFVRRLFRSEPQCTGRALCEIADHTGQFLPSSVRKMALIYFSTNQDGSIHYKSVATGLFSGDSCALIYANCDQEDFFNHLEQFNITNIEDLGEDSIKVNLDSVLASVDVPVENQQQPRVVEQQPTLTITTEQPALFDLLTVMNENGENNNDKTNNSRIIDDIINGIITTVAPL